MNQTIFQFFHWYYSPEGNLWQHAADQAGRMAELGITQMWLPPAYKSALGENEPGYAVYDLYDLGEFDQKGSVRTRYGTKEEYLACIKAIHEHKMGVLADIVLNHRCGADEVESIPVMAVAEENRMEKISEEFRVDAHTRFTFPGRQGMYSQFIWDWHCFTGVCESGEIHLIMSEHTKGEWDDVPENEHGNFDYLMGCDVEFRNQAVVEELKRWGKWYVETTGVDGFRLDAVKHISSDFYPEWIHYLNETFQRHFFCIGEYWKTDLEHLLGYLDSTHHMIQLFDVPLHFNFHEASRQGGDYDLRQIFDGTLLQAKPEMAITFVDNHDTQPLQSLESWVETWFKPHAYAIILLRMQGIPCVFYTALYGSFYEGEKDGEQYEIAIPHTGELEALMKTRAYHAYGEQYEYWDDPNIVGWTRVGVEDKPNSGCAVLMSNRDGGEKRMSLGAHNAGKKMIGHFDETPTEIQLDENGEGNFTVRAGKVNVWVFA